MTSDGPRGPLPDAGWYADPSDSAFLRWWNGDNWSDHRRERVQQVEPTAAPIVSPQSPRPENADPSAYVPMARYTATAAPASPPTRGQVRSAKDRELRRNNSMAYTGLVLSLVGFLFNPLAIPSILGIVFSSIGLAKANELEGSGHRVIGRGTAIAGLIVGLAGLGLMLFRVSQVLS